MAYHGAGIARTAEGKVVFVEGAIAGDMVRPLELQSLPQYDKCVSHELMEPSAARVPAPCSYARECGGCPWQAMSYEEQLRWKRGFVVDALERIGKVANSNELVAACEPSPSKWHYRNKVELDVFRQKGKFCLGLHKKNSHEHIALEECLLLPQAQRQLPAHLAGALNYSLKEEQDKLVRVALRSSRTTGSSELALYMLPSGVNRSLLVKTLNNSRAFNSLVRVIVEDGKLVERKVKKVEVLDGAGYWHEELAGNHLKISAPSFFQPNSAVAEAMIAHLVRTVDQLSLGKDSPVADLYCGAGTFTLPLAKRFRKVYAIESYGSSIRDLRRNLEEVGLSARVEAIGGDVARELATLEPLTLAVVDPPRSGLKPEARRALLEARPEHLIYVSCNPVTMARDLGNLCKEYEILSVAPFDQFPQSYHVETMTVLRVKNCPHRPARSVKPNGAGSSEELHNQQ